MMDDRIVLSLLVDNTAGVLARVAGLFSRRGYNIESLTVGVTADPRYSRMTVVSLGDQTVLEQIKNQLDKLEDVRDIKELKPDRSVYRELMMVKVRASRKWPKTLWINFPVCFIPKPLCYSLSLYRTMP